MKYENGSIALPQGPGLGVELDEDKLKQYHDYYLSTGGYPYDRDSSRPGWFSIVGDNNRWATVRV